MSPRIIGNTRKLRNKCFVTDKAFNHILYYKAPSDTRLINIQTTCHVQSAVSVPFETTNTAHILKVKAIPLQAWTGPEFSRRLRLPDFKTNGT